MLGVLVDGAGDVGAGEGAPPRLPQGLPDGEQDPQEDEPQLISHGRSLGDTAKAENYLLFMI